MNFSALGLLWSTPAVAVDPPTVHLGSSDIKDEQFVRTDTCKALPSTPEQDSFCDVVAVGNRAGWTCTGVLVSPLLVLTAEHCLPLTRVAVGHDTSQPLEQRAVVQTHRPDSRALDAALLQLDAPVEITLHTRRDDATQKAPHADLYAIGFGADSPTGRGGRGVKRGVSLRISGDWGCDPLRAHTTGCLPATEMILGGQGARDTCDGDSGGPVFAPLGDGWQLVAIVSRPIRNSRARCGEGGIYTRVDLLDAWINETIDSTPHPETR